MWHRNKWVQFFILLVIVAVGAITVGSNLFASNQIPKEGDRAPDFALNGLDGAVHHLADYRGKVVLLNFWGSFCPPCVHEMPAIEKQVEKYGPAHFQVVGVNLDESAITVKGFVADHKLTFPILLDKDVVRKQYGVSSYPSTFFLDPQGKIVVRHEGEMDEGFLEQTIAALLAKYSG